MDVEATTAVRQAEVTAQRRMIERAQVRFDIWPARLADDTAYGDAPNLAWLVDERGIDPHIPVFDKSARSNGTFARSDFTFDHANDQYVCAAGKELRPSQRNSAAPRGQIDQDGFIRYRASKKDCSSCNFRMRCTPNTPSRKVTRSVHENARDLARDLALTDAYVTERRQRTNYSII